MSLRALTSLLAFLPLCLVGNVIAAKPNIIYILADDAGIGDFGCYGGKIIQTPNVDRLAAQGMTFIQHYSGSTVCAPSRSVLLTGQHTGRTRVRGNGAGAHLLDKDVTLTEVMQQAGYRTGCIGKWGLGGAETAGAPWKQGVDHFFGFLSQTRAHHYYPEYLYRNDKQVPFPNNPSERTNYCHDLFTSEALTFIRDHQNQPFFLYLPYTIPHVDLDVPEDSKAPYKARFGEETPYGKPGGQHYRSESHPRATFAGMLSRLDRDVGRLMALLAELDLEETTLVIFTSDNGATSAGGADPEFFNSNGPYRGIKRDLYEGGIITPMIARWTGTITAGSTTDHLSSFQDVLPTLAELGGGESPANITGKSFLPTLLGQADMQPKHDYLYWEFMEQGGKRALRQGDWKVVQRRVQKRQALAVELYHLGMDRSETTDLADKHPDKVAALTQLMDEAHTPNAWQALFPTEPSPLRRQKKR